MIKANGRSALILTTTLAMGLLAGLAAPARAGSDDLNSPVFVSPSNSGAQPGTAPAATGQPADNQAPASDQLNDSDRALRDNTATQNATAPTASNDAPAARSAPVMAASGEHSVWDETSLIGKIFIGFGALLTIASAARMFMA
jgi:hypothetical protein